LPPGYYALVGKVADLHAVLAAAPKKAMILFDKLNAEALRKNEDTIPYKRDRLVLWLDPYYPEADAAWLEPELDYWIGRGIKTLVVNNLAHFSLLRGRDVELIAGPWLYAFNLWSAAFLFDQGVKYLIPPQEISKQNLMRLAQELPSRALMPITFSYPHLFKIRGDLEAKYGPTSFMDRDGSSYKLSGRRDYTILSPDKPFSIIDRVPFLKKEGFDKFILDLSCANPSKGMFRDIAKAAANALPLDDSSRFNWKDGFYSDEEKQAPSPKAENAEKRKAPWRSASPDRGSGSGPRKNQERDGRPDSRRNSGGAFRGRTGKGGHERRS